MRWPAMRTHAPNPYLPRWGRYEAEYKRHRNLRPLEQTVQ
jgi:hypothetical protein